MPTSTVVPLIGTLDYLALRFFGFGATSFKNSGSIQTIFSHLRTSSTFPYLSKPRTVYTLPTNAF